MIFSLAHIEVNETREAPILRFVPVFNLHGMLNLDIGKRLGLFSGLAVRNVGYILQEYKDPISHLVYMKKFRSYNLGIPVGVKIGNLNKTFFYAGYEFEYAFHYKEKTFEGIDKVSGMEMISKTTDWFSERQEPIQHGLLLGVQFPYGASLTFKYYLTGFHNLDFTDPVNSKPYEEINSNVYYFSLCVFLFRNFELYVNNPSAGEEGGDLAK